MNRQLVDIYRTGDDYRRYTWEDTNRRQTLTSFYRTFRRYFGRRVLDLGCGEGVLGRILEPTGRSYLGVDANPDWVLDWAHAIWSPYIVEMVMRSHGWRLTHRWPPRPKSSAAKIPESNVDVYRLDRAAARP